jgi:multiple sugar transport system ATP-binding protein
MAPVTLSGVRKVYDDGFVAVHGVDLEVADGEFVVLVGPSGCGKSTTLRMVAGLESITAGTLAIGGRVVNDVPPAERDIAMVFQSYALYPHMSVRENMGFALRLRKRPKDEIDRRVRDAADTLGLGAMLDRRPAHLSGGQRQRVAIGRAIVREPAVFLFDEPLSNLDAKLRAEMRRELAALHRRLGATMLYVTHDQVEAMTLGDRIVVMSQGRVRQVDTPAGVYERPRDTFVAGFLGSPPMNLLAGTLARGAGGLAFRPDGATDAAVPLPAPLAAAAERAMPAHALLGVRPEHVRLLDGDMGDAGDAGDGLAGGPAPLRATIELVEPLGHEQLVFLRLGSVTLAARTAPGRVPPAGAPLAITFDAARLHLFDAESGVVVE